MLKYLLIFIDSYSYSECPPQWKLLTLTQTEYNEVQEMVDDFNSTRQPYFYPQMYLYPIDNQDNYDDVKDWIQELKTDVIKWKQRKEKLYKD